MRPHQLTIEAFGPYADPVRIAFDALSREGLFLIHGRTGAGKTFLLDALCFALYGEVSGDRNVKGLRSDHAPPGAVPRVGLEFSSGEARYRVERSPAHSAPRSRGGGTTEKAAQAVLFRLRGGEREAIASRTTEVTREVEGLIGLNASQFRQVILLPQGKFAEVLRAKADERETLLRTLFDTGLFERAAFWLEEQAKAARLQALSTTRGQEVLRQQAAREWNPWRGPEDPDTVPADQAELDRLEERLGTVVAAASARLAEATRALTVAEQARQATLALADRWTRRATALARLREQESKAEVVETYRERWRRAERAEALRPSLEAERAARQALAVEVERVGGLLRQAIQARQAARALPPAVSSLPLNSLPGPEALNDATSALAARRAEVSALVSQAEEGARARARERQAREELQRLEGVRARAEEALNTRRQERQASEAAVAKARTARDQLDGLRRAAEEARRQAVAVAALPALRDKTSAAIAARNQAEAKRNQASAALLTLRHQQISGMASRLAEGLIEGTPCPVCGSSQHPAPALADAGRPNPDEATLQAAETAVSAATREAQQAAAAVAAAEAELKAMVEKARAQPAEGDPAALDPGGSDPAGLGAPDPAEARARADEAAAALGQAQAAAGAVEALEGALLAHDQALRQLTEQQRETETALALSREAGLDAGARARALEAELTGALGEGVEPRAVLTGFAPLEGALNALAASLQSHNQALSRQEACAARLAQDLAASVFADGEEATAAMAEEGLRKRWAERIAAYDKEVSELRGMLGAEDLADLPDDCPDIVGVETVWRAADTARLAALERLSQARGSLEDLARLAAEHRQGDTLLAQQREEAQRLSGVAERCLGKSPPYISLQRWVLAAYLEEICGHANLRLDLMTSGRYQLRLSDEGGRGGRQAGLGLKVLDAYTGEEREVNSLSGGETFQASLALALGVADTVEARSGGVHLETLFIDEGFGTLDPDNLQLAMDELDRLREGGRMIGIISHVGALKERIQAGIEVRANERGSTARVVRTAME
ncbi:MAG: SMC family ATPase [Cyanobacteria bacterium K_Offshore_surface_m2_239]|nr:SMC family ATPase [Cyanobacteria bacterium K_Offshore_surface_m2_239]